MISKTLVGRLSEFLLIFPTIAVFSALLPEGFKTMRPPRKHELVRKRLNLQRAKGLQTRALRRGVKNRNFPKVVRRGCKTFVGPKGAEPCFAPVAPVQEVFRSLSPKRPLAPSPDHFREFPIWTPLLPRQRKAH